MPDDYWREHRDHKQDVKYGIVRCNECASVMEPHPKKEGRHWCRECGRTIRSPRWYMERDSSDE
jgi:hypothetical protein